MKRFIVILIVATVAATAALGGIMVKDIPVPDNQSIIIFSAVPDGGEGGVVRQNIHFAAETELTLSGGVETDYVRITPNGSTFTAVAKEHKATGQTTFSVTATTAGDEEAGIEGVTATFSFRVLVLGVDFPHLRKSFFEFPVGANVAVSLPVFFAAQQVQLNLPKVPSSIVSQTYGELESYTDEAHGGITRQRWVGEESGISIKPSLDAQNYVRGAGLTGVALRPGIYCRTFDISSYDNGGGYDPFPGANGSGIVIINIYDDRESPKVKVPFAYVPDDDALRVIRHGIEGYTASRLTGEFTRSGDVWTRRISETISTNVSDVWEYRMERDAETGVWTLFGRNYLSDESAPSYTSLATATVPYSGEMPPNVGWTNGVLAAGGSHFYVDGSGFFDYKGEREVEIEGEAEPFTGPIYQQQPVVAAQYAGWTNPPATRFDSGLYLAPDPTGTWRISADPVDVAGDEVKTQTIQHAVIPYHPPTAAALIAELAYRDVAFLLKRKDANPIALNGHLPTDNNLVLRLGKHVAGVPSHYTWLRQLPPPMGTAYSVAVDVDITVETTSTSDTCWWRRTINPNLDDWDGGKDHDHTKVTQSFSGGVDVGAWTRSAVDLVSGALGMQLSNSSSMKYEMLRNRYQESVTHNDPTDPEWTGDSVTKKTETWTEEPSGPGTQSGFVALALASGRNETDSIVSAYAAAAVSASGTVPTTQLRDYLETSQLSGNWGDGSVTTVSNINDEHVGDYTRGLGVNGASPAAFRTSLAIAIPGITVTTVSASLTGSIEKKSRYYFEPGGYPEFLPDETTAVTATHYRVTYSGDTLPPGLIDTGWTHVVTTTNGVTNETWSSDPTGSVYEALYDDYGNDFAYTDGVLPTEGTYKSGSKTTSRTETITKRTETIKTGA